MRRFFGCLPRKLGEKASPFESFLETVVTGPLFIDHVLRNMVLHTKTFAKRGRKKYFMVLDRREGMCGS